VGVTLTGSGVAPEIPREITARCFGSSSTVLPGAQGKTV
jgi:hypothetical protein